MPEELTMKKDVAASAAEAVAPKKPEFSLIDEDLLKSRIYTIRGVKVMLDADLAEIYGYSTKAFNQQVKNNIERFAEDFRFQLSKKEVEELRSKNLTAITSVNDAEILRCKNCTTNISTMSRSNPFVFTEQGIYMLMTVLKGDLAVQQSMALIRLFKQMKDYIAAENAPDVSAGMVALATQRCRQQDHDHHATGGYRRVSHTVRKVVARGGIRARIHTLPKGAFSNYVYASGCWPSCAFHAHSVTCISVNRAVKLEFSGLHAYMPNRIFPAPSSMWQIRI